ncbi:MAG: hypothetical protein ACD_41C00344G0004 [uncultured bacterium]|nr:MAG: hypothetical protein ACD_41C00344G0004 [uncultured bacterium]HBY73904.1 hypothetical protein [Candidatus Kerfeldbacteria bacterium]
MQLWRVLNSLVISSVLLLPTVVLAAEDDCGLAGSGEASAADYVSQPETPYQLEQPFGGQDEITDLAEYIQLVYQFALGIVGIIAVVLIMFGGLRWIAAAGNESIIGEAKEIITSAITGLAIALLSYVILAFLNPQTLSTDVGIFKIPIPAQCKNPPTLVNITSVSGLTGSGQACPNLVTALQEVAIKMKTDSSDAASYCPTCTITVGSAYRTPESQVALYACYTKCVDEGFITSNGLTHLKSGAPEGCSYCAKTAAPCCSNHNKGTAVDLYLSVGGAAGMEDLPGSLAGDGANNNGKAGGVVNYAAGCSGSCDPEIFAAQKKLYDAMLSTGKFSNYKNEWWHFDLKGSCGTEASITCTEVTNSSGIKVASNAYCYATNASNTPLYRYATCAGGTAGCSENFGGYTWYAVSIGDTCDSLQWNGSAEATTPSQTYLEKPSCYTAPDYDYSTY